ncbi:MAG: GAF domain-containing protein [Anaerolineae bacterium]|nr:GAF domain-containing protein [Anaerolineae bacterium]
MKSRDKPRNQLLKEMDLLRNQLASKENQLAGLRQQLNQNWRQLGTMSGWTSTDIKTTLLEEAERARAEAEKHAEELERARLRLKTANRALERRTAQLETAAQVAQEAATILDVGKLLETTVHLISDSFGFYQAAVYLLDEGHKYAVLRAASWEGGEQLMARNYKLLVGHQGIVGEVAKTGEPRFFSADPKRKGLDTSTLAGMRSQTALPLKVRARVIGVLDVRSDEFEAFTEEDVAILQTLADQVAVALDNARLFEQIHHHTQQLLTATEVSKSAMTILDPEKLMHHMVKLIREGFDLHYVGIFLVDKSNTHAILRAGAGKPGYSTLPENHRLRLGSKCIIGQSILEAKALLISRIDDQEYCVLDDSGQISCPNKHALPNTSSELVLPMVTRGKAIGALTIQSTEEEKFSEKDIPVFQTMTDQISTALDNAWLFKETSEAKLAAKEALVVAKQAQKTAEAANKAKSAFLANMSHELRTPLNAILGFTQLMNRDPNLTSEQRENLETINRSGMHLLSLINDVLEMSKIEAGRTVLTIQSFDLHRMLYELETMFMLRASNKGLALHFICNANMPQYVRTDEKKLRQVLTNLLGNAVKFTNDGHVTLRVSGQPECEKDQSAGRVDTVSRCRVFFEVADSGPGISEEDMGVIFEPFVQTVGSREFKEGTGLGLPISRQFVQMMGGELTVRSVLGEGSRFKFSVQVELADAAEVEVDLPPQNVIGLEPGQAAPDGGPYRLLIVEDREANRRLLLELLTSLGEPPDGFAIREAVNGEEALRIWEEWQPHLIWMDMRMPVMDGHEATRRIKEHPLGHKTVIIALTASAFEEDRAEMLEEGCDDFVRKPFHSAVIFEKLAQYLGVRYIYEETTAAPPVSAQRTKAHTQSGLTPAALNNLPDGVLRRLYKAAIETDMQLMDGVIAQIRESDGVLADALFSLANDFEYGKIIDVVEQAPTFSSPPGEK